MPDTRRMVQIAYAKKPAVLAVPSPCAESVQLYHLSGEREHFPVQSGGQATIGFQALWIHGYWTEPGSYEMLLSAA